MQSQQCGSFQAQSLLLRQHSQQQPSLVCNNSMSTRTGFGCSQELINDYAYEMRDLIGQGQFSKVYKGTNLRTGQQVAVKIIDLFKVTDEVFLKMVQNEISILRMVDSPNLLKLYEDYTTIQNKFLVTEYCELGDLNQLIRSKGRLPEKEALKIFKHLLLGLHEIQRNFIIHRDLKPANILISQGIPKLADFGFAVQKNLQSSNQLGNYNVGTPLYMSPESLMANTYSFKSDIWALGIVLYEMLIGYTPFDSNTEQQLKILLLEYKQNGYIHFPQEVFISKQTRDLITSMLSYDPNNRSNINQILSHTHQNRLTHTPQLSQSNSQSARYEIRCDEVPEDGKTQIPYIQTKTFLSKRSFKKTFINGNDQNQTSQFLIGCYEVVKNESQQSLVNVRLENIKLEWCICQMLTKFQVESFDTHAILYQIKNSSDFRNIILLKQENFSKIIETKSNSQEFYKNFKEMLKQKIKSIVTIVNLKIDNGRQKDLNQSSIKASILMLAYLITLYKGIVNNGDFSNINMNMHMYRDVIKPEDWISLNKSINKLNIF